MFSFSSEKNNYRKRTSRNLYRSRTEHYVVLSSSQRLMYSTHYWHYEECDMTFRVYFPLYYTMLPGFSRFLQAWMSSFCSLKFNGNSTRILNIKMHGLWRNQTAVANSLISRTQTHVQYTLNRVKGVSHVLYVPFLCHYRTMPTSRQAMSVIYVLW